MKYVFMGQSLAMAAMLPMISLHELSPSAPDGFPGEGHEIGDEIVDPDALDEDRLHDKMLIDRLKGFLSSLPPRLADIVDRFYWHGETQADIAAAFGVTQSAISHALQNVHRLGRVHFGITEH